jgi:hypothetical protein
MRTSAREDQRKVLCRNRVVACASHDPVGS